MLRPSGMDFRTGMYFNVIAVSILALGMILTVRRIRGTSSYLDVFFPIVLMNWGQAINFLWQFKICFHTVGRRDTYVNRAGQHSTEAVARSGRGWLHRPAALVRC